MKKRRRAARLRVVREPESSCPKADEHTRDEDEAEDSRQIRGCVCGELGQALERGCLRDAVVVAGTGAGHVEFPVNATVLALRSTYFERCFFGAFAEAQTKRLVKANVSAPVMKQVLLYLYTGSYRLSPRNALPLFAAAREMDLQGLVASVRDSVPALLSPATACSVLARATGCDQAEMAAVIRAFVLDHARECLAKNNGLLLLDVQEMKELLASDNLNLAEDQVYDVLLEWGCHRASVASKDPATWSAPERKRLRRTLAPLLPLVRVHLVSRAFLHTCLRPSDLFSPETILMVYGDKLFPGTCPADHPMARPRVVTPQLQPFANADDTVTIMEWVGKGKKLTKIYHASVDGFKAEDFHRKCDTQGATLTLVQDTQGFVCGGFTDIPWAAPDTLEWKRSGTAFLFSVRTPTKAPMTLFKWKSGTATVGHRGDRGPVFGGGADLELCGNCSGWTTLGHSFVTTNSDVPANNCTFFGQGSFAVKDYAVYRVE